MTAWCPLPKLQTALRLATHLGAAAASAKARLTIFVELAAQAVTACRPACMQATANGTTTRMPPASTPTPVLSVPDQSADLRPPQRRRTVSRLVAPVLLPHVTTQHTSCVLLLCLPFTETNCCVGCVACGVAAADTCTWVEHVGSASAGHPANEVPTGEHDCERAGVAPLWVLRTSVCWACARAAALPCKIRAAT